ncbi:MAG: hypothetical protein WCP39_04465, partial [Chlamydiota bacterium]
GILAKSSTWILMAVATVATACFALHFCYKNIVELTNPITIGIGNINASKSLGNKLLKIALVSASGCFAFKTIKWFIVGSNPEHIANSAERLGQKVGRWIHLHST